MKYNKKIHNINVQQDNDIDFSMAFGNLCNLFFFPKIL